MGQRDDVFRINRKKADLNQSALWDSVKESYNETYISYQLNFSQVRDLISGLGCVGDDGDLGAGLEDDVPKQVELVPGKWERDGDPVRAEPSGATDPMQISFGVPRNVL